MLRFLLRFFANHNHDEVVRKLSDSYLMRRAAQMAVSVFYRAKSITQEMKEERVKDLNPEKLKSFLEKFQNNVKEEIQKAKDELSDKTKK